MLSRQARFDAAIAAGEPKTGRRPGPPKFRRPSSADAEALFAPKGDGRPATEVRAIVRWFDPLRFGFVRCDNGDAFLPRAVAGDADLPIGATLTVILTDDGRGRSPVVAEILAVDRSTACPVAEPIRPPLVSNRLEFGRLIVRTDRFGFVKPDSGEPTNIYVPKTRLHDPDAQDLEVGDAVEVSVADGHRGPVATKIRRRL